MPDVPILIDVKEASRLSGIPLSTMRKTFMKVRPSNIPPPPPHKRIGRAVYVVASKLEAWTNSLPGDQEMRKLGRPTKAEAIAKREIRALIEGRDAQ